MNTSVYCLVPEALADELLEPLRAHYRADPDVKVIVDRRRADRVLGADARGADEDDRRRPAMPRDFAASLPAGLAVHAGALRWEQRLRPVRRRLQDAGLDTLLDLIAEGEDDAYSEVYWRYASRVRARLARRFEDPQRLDAAMKEAFGRLMDELARLDPGSDAFEAFLVAVADAVADAHTANVSREGPGSARRASAAR